jgi:FtsP/CotA-like multicopper oxidase with cupredoxin domain
MIQALRVWGSRMFHCHILEHAELGMMMVMETL